MRDDHAARPGGPGIAVALRIEDNGLRDRIRAALRELPDIDVARSVAGREPGEPGAAGAPITITDSIEALRRASPDGPVIVLTDRIRARAALRAGAAGVLSRSAGAAALRVAMDAMRHGLAVVPAGGLWGAEEEDDRRLTGRELEVLKLLAEGASNKMIARELAVSIHTAKFHVASILEKLDATGRTDAVAHAVRLGLLML
jgi:DNA-binding NarL/FixJ family response regulator